MTKTTFHTVCIVVASILFIVAAICAWGLIPLAWEVAALFGVAALIASRV